MGVSRSTPRARVFRSIQHFTVTIADGQASGTAPITAVNTARTFLVHLGASGAATAQHMFARLTLTNSTTVTATRGSSTTTDTVTVAGIAVEGY